MAVRSLGTKAQARTIAGRANRILRAGLEATGIPNYPAVRDLIRK